MEIILNIFNNQYIRFLTILLGTILIIALSYFLIKFIVKKIAGKKKVYMSFILKQILKPSLMLVFLLGLFTSLKSITEINLYTFPVGDNTYILIDSIFFVIVTLVISLLVSRILTVIMIGFTKVKKDFKRAPGLINKLLSAIIFIIGIAIILAYFEIDITPLIAGVGLGALAIGLALQSTLSNLFAGMHLLSDKPINVGDFIELDKDNSGFIEDIGWRSTRIRMLTDNLLIIPNAKLADSNIINYSMPKQDLSIWVPCGVAYESDLKKVEKITLEVAKKIQENTEGAVKSFEPAFRYREFGDSNINFITILRIEEPMKRFTVRNEFIKELKERYDKEGIEISWPIRKIYNISEKKRR